MLSAIVSIAFLGGLLRIADLEKYTFPDIVSPGFVAIVIAYAIGLSLRSAQLYVTLPLWQRVRYANWMAVVSRHQALFSLAPSGLGDLGYPGLAERYTGLAPSQSLHPILVMRLRDLMFLIFAAGMGLAAHTPVPGMIYAASSAVLVGMFLLPNRLAAAAQRSVVLKRILPVPKDDKAMQLPFGRQAVLAVLTLLAWASSMLSVWLAFRAVGINLLVTETLFIIAVLNAVGAIGLSVAGLGTTEAGLAGGLVILGFDLDQAATSALIVRPTLLIANLMAAFTLACLAELTRRT